MKYMDQEKYDSAVIQFKKAIQIDPKFAEAHYQLARADLKLQHNQEAFREMSQTVELDPNNYKARQALGGMFLASGSHYYSNAEEQARYITDHDPSNSARASSCWATCCWLRSTMKTRWPRSAGRSR